MYVSCIIMYIITIIIIIILLVIVIIIVLIIINIIIVTIVIIVIISFYLLRKSIWISWNIKGNIENDERGNITTSVLSMAMQYSIRNPDIKDRPCLDRIVIYSFDISNHCRDQKSETM